MNILCVSGARTLMHIASYPSLTICVHLIFYLLVFEYLRIVVFLIYVCPVAVAAKDQL